jgi:hypothetical protein
MQSNVIRFPKNQEARRRGLNRETQLIDIIKNIMHDLNCEIDVERQMIVLSQMARALGISEEDAEYLLQLT